METSQLSYGKVGQSMRSGEEIRQKLMYYQGMLAAIEALGSVDRPDAFLTLASYLPKEALPVVGTSTHIDEFLERLPLGERQWVEGLFDLPGFYIEKVVGNRIVILQWVLGGG